MEFLIRAFRVGGVPSHLRHSYQHAVAHATIALLSNSPLDADLQFRLVNELSLLAEAESTSPILRRRIRQWLNYALDPSSRKTVSPLNDGATRFVLGKIGLPSERIDRIRTVIERIKRWATEGPPDELRWIERWREAWNIFQHNPTAFRGSYSRQLWTFIHLVLREPFIEPSDPSFSWKRQFTAPQRTGLVVEGRQWKSAVDGFRWDEVRQLRDGIRFRETVLRWMDPEEFHQWEQSPLAIQIRRHDQNSKRRLTWQEWILGFLPVYFGFHRIATKRRLGTAS